MYGFKGEVMWVTGDTPLWKGMNEKSGSEDPSQS